MSTVKPLLAGALICCLGASVFAAPPTKEEIAKAIEQLDGDNFAQRKKAEVFLRAAGKAGEPALKAARVGASLEMTRRVDEILSDFKWGIYPDTPKKILEIIGRYRGADANVKRNVFGELARLQGPGYFVLIKFASAEETPELRAEVVDFLASGAERSAAVLLAAGEDEVVEDLLELCMATEREQAGRNFAAFLLLKRRLDEQIPAYVAKAKTDKKAGALLSLLYKGKGDLAAARAAAEKADRHELAEALLVEQGDWKELVKRVGTQARPLTEEEALGYEMAYRRLAGEDAEVDKVVARLQKLAGQENGNVGLAAKALFLNDRAPAGLALLKDKKNYLAAFEVMCAQLQYRAALDFVKDIKADDLEPALALELRRAQVLHHLGEKEQALKHLARIADEWKEGENIESYRDLVKAELRLGLKEQALSHAAHVLTPPHNDDRAGRLLALLFPDRGETAEVWWKFFRKKHPEDKALASLQRVRDVLENRADKEAFAALLDEAERAAAGLPLAERSPWVLALAETALRGGRADRGQNLLEKAVLLADGSASLLRLGDVLAGKKDWAAAADRYRHAWEQDRTQPLPLYLCGWALVQAGKADEGRKLMELAHVIPLGNEATRYVFAQALTRRGQQAEADREWQLILRVGPDEGWHANETLRHIAYEQMGRKQYAQAADTFERFRLRCLRANTSFVEYGAYIHVPVLIHQNHARALLAAGKFEEAKKEMRQCLAVLPGNLNLPIQLVSDLEKADRKADADDLFKQAFAVHEKLCVDHPKSAALHNSLAWLTAGCRRDLDKGLEHSKKAVELEPKQAGYLDTLAEVHFQRSDKDEAVKLLKRCLELEPNNGYFKKQLKRIEAGDRAAELPESGT